jgi:uncharacterized membrane protein YfcA
MDILLALRDHLPIDWPVYLPVAGIAANAFTLAGAGVAVGFLSGMFGVGGGFLITPILIFLGIPTEVAIATGANQAVATSVSGAAAQWQRNNVDVKMGVVLLVSGLVGATLGIQLVSVLRRIGQFEAFVSLCYVVLLGAVGILMLIESAGTVWKTQKQPIQPHHIPRAQRHSWVHGLPFKMRFPHSKLYISIVPAVLVGAFAGMLTTVMGVGGGFILVPAMIYLLNMRTSIAIGTSLFEIVFVSAAATVLQAVTLQSVDILLGAILIFSGVVGTQLGARAGGSLKAEQLRLLLALLVLGVCIRVAVNLVVEPDDLYSLVMIPRG